jgi:hypothetical protein
MPVLVSGAPLPFKIVFGIVDDVLPADFGLVAALANGAVEVNVIAIEITIACAIRVRFMEPPGPLLQIG